MSGYFDLQVNGYAGVDFNSDDLTDEDWRRVCDRMVADGVQRFLPTVITDELGAMVRRVDAIVRARDSMPEVAKLVAGIHVEGPFISGEEGYVGAHPKQHVLSPTVDRAMRLIEAGQGHVRLLTLAPETSGANSAIKRLCDEGVLVAGGHSNASRDCLQAAIDHGLQLFTHLGNGCPGLLPRHDNIISRVLSLSDQIAISFIADGHHVPWFALANYLARIPDENIIIVTDAITAAGLGPGRYRLGDQWVDVDEDLAAWAEGREHFAGCATTMRQMENGLIENLNFSRETIQSWMTTHPARLLGE